MPKFKFTATTPDGATVQRSRERPDGGHGASRPGGQRSLAGRRFERRRASSLSKSPRRRSSVESLMHFSRQMAVFMRAGIPVLESMEVMTEEVGDKVFQQRPGRDV